jgi:hypothetical protein
MFCDPRSTKSPLPGDLVISRQPASGLIWRYTVALWPYLDRVATTYPTYGDALKCACEYARGKAVAVWRNDSIDARNPALENVTPAEWKWDASGAEQRVSERAS